MDQLKYPALPVVDGWKDRWNSGIRYKGVWADEDGLRYITQAQEWTPVLGEIDTVAEAALLARFDVSEYAPRLNCLESNVVVVDGGFDVLVYEGSCAWRKADRHGGLWAVRKRVDRTGRVTELGRLAYAPPDCGGEQPFR